MKVDWGKAEIPVLVWARLHCKMNLKRPMKDRSARDQPPKRRIDCDQPSPAVRLAALVQDLAKHKRMSVDSCFEEMLLHTNEGVGPHTPTTLAYIQELKKNHGIDYDSHASYRFVEA